MRLCSLTIENFRKLRGPLRLEGFSRGLNLVCEPNETGKSTILDAIRAAFFERHGAKSQRIQTFRPYGQSVAPTVDVEFDIGDTTWTLRKRFLQSPSVSLESSRGRFQSDAAEEKLQELLGFARASNRGADDDSRGALGLLWVEQGQSFQLTAPGQTARRTFEEALAGEVGLVTGGRRTRNVVAAVDKAIAELLTPTGKPARRLVEALEAAAAAQADAEAAAADLANFNTTLDQLDGKRAAERAARRERDDPEEAAAEARLDKDIEAAKTLASALSRAEAEAKSAQSKREKLTAEQEARTKAEEAMRSAEKRFADAAAALDAYADTLATAHGGNQSAETALAAARDHETKVHSASDSASKALTAGEQARALLAAFRRLDEAEGLAAQILALEQSIEANRLTAKAAESIDELDRRLLRAQGMAAAASPQLTIRPEDAARGITLNGVEVGEAITFIASERQVVAVEGVVEIVVTPPASGARAEAERAVAQADLKHALAQYCVASPEAARAEAARRNSEAAELKSLRVQATRLCPADEALKIPAGLDALRAALASRTRPAEPGAIDQLEQVARAAERDHRAAVTAVHAAEARRSVALEAFQDSLRTQERLAARKAATKDELDRQSTELAAMRARRPETELAAELEAARAAEVTALAELTQLREASAGLDLVSLSRRRESMRRARANLEAELQSLATDIARLEERARTMGADGPASRAQAAAELAAAAQAKADRLTEEAETLALLKRTIAEAEAAATRRYLEPVKSRITPYLRRLLPTAELDLDMEFRPTGLVRAGRAEGTDDLSKGTQEQLAILTRLAFADLLLAKGKPASLILDDALVFADDARFATMTEILVEASSRMQVIVLTCHTRAWRGVEATRVELAETAAS